MLFSLQEISRETKTAKLEIGQYTELCAIFFKTTID